MILIFLLREITQNVKRVLEQDIIAIAQVPAQAQGIGLASTGAIHQLAKWIKEKEMKSYEQAALNILRGNYGDTTEELEQLQEAVHPDALHVKPVKVQGQTKYKVHAVGKNFSSGIKPGEHLSDSELDDFSEMGGRIKHMKEQVKPEVEKAFPATGVKKNPPMKGVSTMPKDKERRGPIPAGSMKEDAEELEEVGPGRSDPKAKDREDSDKLMKDFLAKGGTVQQGKSKVPKRSGRMVARGSLSSGERRVNPQGGKSFVGRMEEVEEDLDYTLISHNSFKVFLPESLTYVDYLNAAKLFEDSEVVRIADECFQEQDESIIVASYAIETLREEIQSFIDQGHEVSLPKYTGETDNPGVEFIVTDKESGIITKYIHHGIVNRP